MSKKIEGIVASGKTSKGLQKVGEKGGVFITTNSREVMMLAGRVGLENANVKILELPPGTVIVIDDSQDYEVYEVVRKRIK